ncbi:MAG: Spy/CpxP family protein refolding chaperone [Acidobacteriia bacterium]|nr:Spy/CpxP family protein refolding chaperone [Terriglobia bacterium]
MKTALAVVGLALILAWPIHGQDGPPGPPAPGAPETAPADAPAPPPEFRGPHGPAHFRTDGPRGRGFGAWWKDSEIVAKLQLSDDQVKRIEETFFSHRLKLIDLRADLEKQELQLRPLLDADQPDEQKVASQIDAITAARGRLEKENAMMMLAIRRVLTVDQWKKLQTLREEPLPAPGGNRREFHPDKGFHPPS